MYDLSDVAKRKEIIICDYDNIVQIPDEYILNKIIIPKKEIFKNFISLDKIGDNHLLKIISRTEIDFIKWLSKIEFNYGQLYEKLYFYDDNMYNDSVYGEFINVIISLYRFNYLDSVYILVDKRDKRKEKSLEKVFEPKLMDKVKFIEANDKVEYIKSNLEQFTLCSLYDGGKISDLMIHFNNKTKCFLLPRYGFNFTHGNKNMFKLKHNLDILANETNCEFGIYFPYVFKDVGVG